MSGKKHSGIHKSTEQAQAAKTAKNTQTDRRTLEMTDVALYAAHAHGGVLGPAATNDIAQGCGLDGVTTARTLANHN